MKMMLRGVRRNKQGLITQLPETLFGYCEALNSLMGV